MKDVYFSIKENIEACPGTYQMVLMGDTSEITAPGQFINIKLDGLFLRRPMSICDYDEGSLTIVYRVVGEGTEMMSKMTEGDGFYALVGLGNGFDLEAIPKGAVMVGGGAGAMPMYALLKELIERDNHEKDETQNPSTTNTSDTTVVDINANTNPGAYKLIIGFNSESDIFFMKEFEALGIEVIPATLDGSMGVKGTVVDAMKMLGQGEKLPYVCACGPDPMIEAVHKWAEDGQYDLSARMGCGFGACVGCTIETNSGPKRVCKEGPIFKQEDIIW